MSPSKGGGREEIHGLHLAWVRGSEVPDGEGWLSPPEREVLAGLTLEKRRADWLLGRWAARVAVQDLLGRPVPELAVLAGEDGRPFADFGGGLEAGSTLSLSISHAGGLGLAAVKRGGVGLGCDVEVIEPRSDGFVADYFTEDERTAVYRAADDDRALLANLVWSAKESALKAMGEGLRLDTRTVEVDTTILRVNGSKWSPLVVTGPGGRIFRGHWRVREGLVWTVLTESVA